MEGISKQQTGFRFGKYQLKVLETIGEVIYNGRTYRLVTVQTEAGQLYLSLRLYNRQGKFIKQFLFEPEVLQSLTCLFQKTSRELKRQQFRQNSQRI